MTLLTDPQELQIALSWDKERASDPQEKRRLRELIRQQINRLRSKTSGPGGIAPVDGRIEAFLQSHLGHCDAALQLPRGAFALRRHGVARELSLPENGHEFKTDLVSSYRCANGTLNNPKADRRTTAGTFHVAEGGLPIPGDKRAVPQQVFARLFDAAVNAPDDLLTLPYTSQSKQPDHTWVTLLLRPRVRPAVAGYCDAKTLETRFFVPGSLVSNLDFVESIFGNAGDALLTENDAGLDAHGWTGHTGCVILAPHLIMQTKKELGLPHWDDATERQRHDSMCWKEADERYNDGGAFKISCRDRSGVMVTLIADNYYGYCKKEVKTQISYSANLMGDAEEEHAGGALAFASYSLGDEFQVNSRRYNGATFADVASKYSSFIEVFPEGYGVDRSDESIIYIPENAKVTLIEKCVKWQTADGEQRIALDPAKIYIAPSGYKICLEKHPQAPSWRLVGTVGEGINCHKPCTVSGGGKSEISKSIDDYMLFGPIFTGDREEDFAWLEQIFSRDYSKRWSAEYTGRTDYTEVESRGLLNPDRSLGSVIQLLTHSPDYNEDYNQWLASIPEHVYSMALIIKRFVRDENDEWRGLFGVDIVNGSPGHELKMGERKLVGTYLRVGLDDNRWRTFKLRQDFMPAMKVQQQDDISCSTVVPAHAVGEVGPGTRPAESYKFVQNCEYRLFQRPDDAVHRGLDTQTEWDLSRKSNFISNFEPLATGEVRELVADAIEFDKFSEPMANMLLSASQNDAGFVVSSASPRIVDGKPTKNPRYLQDRPDMVKTRDTYVAMRGMQLHRKLASGAPVHIPVGAVLSGRRNNPPDAAAGIRSLAVYSPLHYQQLPELLMDYVASLTGKSPSTTGAGSEGALTKGPFNALMPAADLNAIIVSMILTDVGAFSTAAGHIGPRFEVGHDISLLVPEVWCRLGPNERHPANMIEEGMLEKVEDFEHNGQPIPASRLGYRITRKFVRTFLARVFDNPSKVFTDEILKPELQDPESFADGILHIAEAQQRIAQRYREDGNFELACPPLQAILNIMATGQHEGKTIEDASVRDMFTRESMLASDWYRGRLNHRQQSQLEHWQAFESRLDAAIEAGVAGLDLHSRLEFVRGMIANVSSPGYVDNIVGSIGTDPMIPQTAATIS